MFQRFRWVFLCVILMGCASMALAQAEFSADVFDLQKSTSQPQAKIYFTKDKMRVEPTGNTKGAGAYIADFAKQTSMVVMAQQHMYMEMPLQSQMQKAGYSFFEAGDVENACGDWQKVTRNEGRSCHRIGSDSVNGRSAVKYEATGSNGDVGHFWLDPKLRFPIKWDGKNGGGELRNIQEGSQPASLFEIPSGYTKFQMPAGMQMPQR